MMKKLDDIKLLIFDIDGTILIQDENTVTPNVKKALNQAKENGYEVMIATGRHFRFIPQELLDDVDANYLVTVNGGCLVDKNGKVLKQHPMDQEELEKLVKLCDKSGVAIAFKCKDDIVVYTYYDMFVEGYVGLNSPFAKLLVDDTKNRNYHKTIGPALGAFLIGDHPTIHKMQDEFPKFTFARSHAVGYDVFMNETTKGSTVESFLYDNGFTWDNAITFGDAGNDIDMIKRASIGIALGNAPHYVQKEADFVSDTVENDGVVQALKHFKII